MDDWLDEDLGAWLVFVFSSVLGESAGRRGAVRVRFIVVADGVVGAARRSERAGDACRAGAGRERWPVGIRKQGTCTSLVLAPGMEAAAVSEARD
jgi:hypothetical protein